MTEDNNNEDEIYELDIEELISGVKEKLNNNEDTMEILKDIAIEGLITSVTISNIFNEDNNVIPIYNILIGNDIFEEDDEEEMFEYYLFGEGKSIREALENAIKSFEEDCEDIDDISEVSCCEFFPLCQCEDNKNAE